MLSKTVKDPILSKRGHDNCVIGRPYLLINRCTWQPEPTIVPLSLQSGRAAFCLGLPTVCYMGYEAYRGIHSAAVVFALEKGDLYIYPSIHPSIHPNIT